jgi:hypothetical protein
MGESRVTAEIQCALWNLNIKENVSTSDLVRAVFSFPKGTSPPEFKYDRSGDRGFLQISSGRDYKQKREYDTGFHNEWVWDMELSTQVKWKFEINLGLGKGNLNLTNLPITDLKLDCGLGKVTVLFESLNPEEMRKMEVKTGLGFFRGTNLGFANTDRMKFDVGMGTATIDLRGKNNLERIKISIEVGLGSATILIPRNYGVELRKTSSFLSTVSMEDFYQEKEDLYTSYNFAKSKQKIYLNAEVGAGSINIVWVE